MSKDLISSDEASWRLEEINISGAQFAELLCKNDEPLLIGLLPGQRVHDPVDLSRITSLRVRAENQVVAGGLTWADTKLSWPRLVDAFEKRGRKVRMPLRIAPELLQLSSQPDPSRRLLGDPRPPVPLMAFMRSAPEAQPPPRRASQEWFAAAAYSRLAPASGKPPRGKRGLRSGIRDKAAASMRQALDEKELTETELRTMREKVLADRFGVSRDTARKARNDVLESFVESTNDK